MTKTLSISRMFRTVATVVTVTAIALTHPTPRSAEACGGYGEALTPSYQARRVLNWYSYAIAQRSQDLLSNVLAENATFTTEHQPSGCCPAPSFTRAHFVAQVLAQPHRVERVISLLANEDMTFTAQLSVLRGRQRFTEHLTISEDENGSFRVTRLIAVPSHSTV
jgi:hypothetical protein